LARAATELQLAELLFRFDTKLLDISLGNAMLQVYAQGLSSNISVQSVLFLQPSEPYLVNISARNWA
jgi:hypothetical protein